MDAEHLHILFLEMTFQAADVALRCVEMFVLFHL